MFARTGKIVGFLPRESDTRLLLALLSCFLPFLCVACEHRTILIDPTAPADTLDTDGDGDGTLQKADLTVTVVLTGEDSALAAMIGIGNGVLPDAEVTIERSGTAGSLQSAVTDSAGTVQFEGLLEGRYSVSTIRILTPEEIAQLGAENADVNAFGGGAEKKVEPPSTETSLEAVAGRRGSLVISELSVPIARLPSGNDYLYGDYIELYNNSDAPISLKGKILSRIIEYGTRAYDEYRCERWEPYQADPEGMWTRYFEAFPSGVLRPGETVVVAQDAIDHRVVNSRLQDLTRADFELIGPADVDNPSVPNMVSLGAVYTDGVARTHGLPWGVTDIIVAVSDVLDLESLPVNIPIHQLNDHRRIPGEKILDVLSIAPTPEQEAAMDFLSPKCPRFTHENFDRRHASLLDTYALNGVQRRLFATLPDGRKILLRTKTSARDFRAGPATPGWIPN